MFFCWILLLLDVFAEQKEFSVGIPKDLFSVLMCHGSVNGKLQMCAESVCVFSELHIKCAVLFFEADRLHVIGIKIADGAVQRITRPIGILRIANTVIELHIAPVTQIIKRAG